LVIITKKDFVKYGVKEDAVDGIANFLNSLLKVDLIFVLREMGDNKIKISLRAKNNSYDVSKLALFFNGGGHKKASGFIVNGSLQFCNNGWKIV
jgi:phosphoesterase RecJ-like protein